LKFGITLPDLKPRVLADLAKCAEASGWDGLFAWDMIYGIDVWVSLASVAMVTERIRFGTMLTPLTRRRPWKVASEVVTLDHLSNGRVILPVGLGATGESHTHNWFEQVGEELDRKVRAKRLDESLDIIRGLWTGEPFSYSGEHYEIKSLTFSPKPVQSPRVPIWVVGAWPRMKSMRRVLGCDGILPIKMNDQRGMEDLKPGDIREMKSWIDENRSETTPFDIVIEGETPGDDAAKAASILQPLADSGVTWWLESVWATPETEGGLEGMRTRINRGPPKPL
jgi:alkanesulfonate monooxygenase SsuD/methylene tetrahydromethanopterin reductase-like flavin-dependent oxidoreductase (luciferase family)